MTVTIQPTNNAALLASIHASAFPDPWTEAAFVELLALSSSQALVCGNQAMVLYQQVAGEVEILTFAVRPEYQRMGIGKALLQALIARVRQDRGQKIFLEVAAHNQAAQALYKSAGFEHYHTRVAYYKHGEDAQLLQCVIV